MVLREMPSRPTEPSSRRPSPRQHSSRRPSSRRPSFLRRGSERRRVALGFVLVALVLAVLAPVTACQGGGQTSGESHFGKTKAFLRICEDGTCGSGDDCVCAVCTVSCVGVDECRRRIVGDATDVEIPATVVCRAPMCGDNVDDENDPAAGSVCDVECTEDADCAFLDRDAQNSETDRGELHFCNAGYCRTLAEPDEPVTFSEELQTVCPAGMQLVPGDGTASGVGVCLDLVEVTVEAYATCVDAGSCPEPAAGNSLTAGREQHPVHFVSEADAEAFCAFRSARLPAWDEWRAAASGGIAATAYPWGDEVPAPDDDPPRVCGLGETTTCEVGSFSAGNGPWGHADLSGNVAEWTRLDEGHCIAGGHFESQPEELGAEECVAPGTSGTPDTQAPGEHVGFRCARDL